MITLQELKQNNPAFAGTAECQYCQSPLNLDLMGDGKLVGRFMSRGSRVLWSQYNRENAERYLAHCKEQCEKIRAARLGHEAIKKVCGYWGYDSEVFSRIEAASKENQRRWELAEKVLATLDEFPADPFPFNARIEELSVMLDGLTPDDLEYELLDEQEEMARLKERAEWVELVHSDNVMAKAEWQINRPEWGFA